MTVSKLSARAAAAAGQRVGSRHYVAKFKCHVCGKPYAKPTLFMTHLKSHKAGDGITIGKQKIAPLPDWTKPHLSSEHPLPTCSQCRFPEDLETER
jgi:hypothetical protein